MEPTIDPTSQPAPRDGMASVENGARFDETITVRVQRSWKSVRGRWRWDDSKGLYFYRYDEPTVFDMRFHDEYQQEFGPWQVDVPELVRFLNMDLDLED